MIDDIILLGYQEKAVEAIVEDSLHYLNNKRRHELTLKSPTGSGKTVMATAIMETISEEYDNVAFLWTSVGDGNLHVQSGNSIAEKTTLLTVKQVEECYLGAPLDHADVFVVNWQKLNGKNNILVKEGENHNFFDLLNKTRDQERKIVLMIDESHLGAGQNSNTVKIKDRINADIVINISATPTPGQTPTHVVTFRDVAETGIVKKGIIINRDVDPADENGELSALVKAALARRERLKSLYPNNINPLLLISLPNGSEKRKEVEYLLGLHGITTDNGKLATWFSGDDKRNEKEVRRNNNPVEVLIFKTAVATGWDCPRAHVLLKLRKTKRESFSRQLTGRILRMPERKHYQSDELNQAYIYTDYDNQPKLEEDMYPVTAGRQKKTLLKSGIELELTVRKKKKLERSQLYAATFKPIFAKEMDKHDLKSDYSKGSTSIIGETHMTLDGEVTKRSDKIILQPGATSVGEQVLDNIKEIAKESGISSTTSFRTLVIIIMTYINQRFGYTQVDGRIQGLIINSHLPVFRKALENAFVEYFKVFSEQVEKGQYREYKWSPPKEIWVDEDETPKGRWAKYAYGKFFDELNSLEYDYADKLDQNPHVTWWLKNGDSGNDWFSIPYAGGKNFYPDFIIKYDDGTVKIAETKGSNLDPLQQDKADALKAYGLKHDIDTEWYVKK